MSPTDLAKLVKTLAQSARALASAGDVVSAEQVYRRILEAAPYHAPSLSFLANQAYALGDAEQALALIDKAIQGNPRAPLLFQNRALINKYLGDLGAAMRDLDDALRLQPVYPVALLHKASLQKDTGDRDGAVRTALMAWQQLPAPETMANDATIPREIRELVMECANLLRSTQLILIDSELEPVMERFGKESLQRLFAGVAAYAGLSAQTESSRPQRGGVHIPGLTYSPILPGGPHPWSAELAAALPTLHTEADRILTPSTPDNQTAEQLAAADIGGMLRYTLQPTSSERDKAIVSLLGTAPLTHEPEDEIALLLLPPGRYILRTGQGNNWKLTSYVPLDAQSKATLMIDTAAVDLVTGTGVLASQLSDHALNVEGHRPLMLLAFPIWHPELSEAEVAGIPAVLRGIKRFHGKYQQAQTALTR
ncbi:MAG: hypothetical protein KGJ08_09305 [Gammaproteobacteria bacterium]|nr:hypothetical protein [Gammaproteobacteria bacterium]